MEQMLYLSEDKNLAFVQMQITLHLRKWQKVLSLQTNMEQVFM